MLANMTQEQTNKENREHCKEIALRLEAYADGRMYRCPKCGEHVEDNILFCDCGEQVDLINGEWELLGLYDFFEDCLDIEYRVDSHKELRSVRIMVAFGGPNIYIDTASGAVELYWWDDRASCLIDSDAIEAVLEWASELWGCM